MNVILLSGGSGKRLWPLSNDICSKQFIKILKTEAGECESMLQRTYRGIKNASKNSRITIATARSQVETINEQLKGEAFEISVEPCRRDTFPAIALATAYLHDVKNVPEDEAVVVVPIDSYAENAYFHTLNKLYKLAKNSDFNLSLMGISPTYPSEKYGYIIPEDRNEVSRVKTFKEKPNKEIAKEYIQQGALWNGGIFAYKLKYVLDIAHKLVKFDNYNDLYNKYEAMEKISFDYEVVEKEKNVQVIRFTGQWKDIGTWNTMTEVMDEKSIGNVILNDECENSYIINELNIPILGMGIKDIVVIATPKGILVTDKMQSSNIAPYVDKIGDASQR